MSILGSLIVTLSANTASFVEGLTGASKTARTVGREIESSFSTLGSVASSALAPFGEMGAAVGNTLGQIGIMAGSAIQSIGKLSGGTGALAVGLGAIAGASAAVTAGVVGLVVHTAMAQAELGGMAQKTGVSTQTLAGLGLAARETGVPIETLAKGLEFMNSNAVKAAIGPKATATAFSRLGVDVKDASGKMRDSTAIFTDLFAKISTLPQPEQGYFMKAIFGRGGSELLPMMDLTRERLAEIVKLAKDLDLGNPQTVAASQKFKETVEDIKAEFESMALQLTKDMLPAIQFIATKIEEGFKSGSLQTFIGYLAWASKETLGLGNELFHVFEQIGIVFEGLGGAIIATFNAIGAVIEATARAAVGDFSGASGALKAGLGGLKDEWNNFSGAMKKSLADQAAFKSGVWSQQGVLPPPPAHRGTADLTKTKGDTTLDRIKERIAALQQETADWGNLASAGTQAEALIAEALKKGNEEFGKLRAEAAKDKTGKSMPFVLANEDTIRAAGAASVYGAAIKAVTGELDKSRIKLEEEAKSALAMAGAYEQGGAAIAKAAIGKQLAKETEEATKLAEAYSLRKASFDQYVAGKAALGGAAGPVQGENVPPATLELLKNGADQAAASLAVLADKASDVASDKLTEELKKQSHEFVALRPYVDALSSSYAAGEAAVRKARIELELARFEEEQLGKGIDPSKTTVTVTGDGGITTTMTLLQQKRTLLEETDQQAHQNAIRELADRYSINALYQAEIPTLKEIQKVMRDTNQETLLIDARLFDAEQQLIHQWDEAAFKVGTFGEKTRGILNEIALEGQNAGKKIAEAFLSAYDSLTGALAKLATGQKADFKQILQSLSEQIIKAEIQKGIGALTSSLGFGKIPGLSAKPDGSTESLALWVQMAGGAGGAGGLLGKSSGGFFANLLGVKTPGAKADGSKSNPFYVISAKDKSDVMGQITGLFGKVAGLFGGGIPFFGGMKPGGISGSFGGPTSVPTTVSTLPNEIGFGGFMAAGGDLTPGKSYIAGEKGPEIVRGPGTVTPMSKLGGGHQTSITNNFPVFKDHDMFRRSAPQLMAHQHRQMSIAYARS